MKFYFKKPQERMPEENVPVLVHFERDETEGETAWAIGHYDGSKWCFDTPRAVFDHAARYQIPNGEDVVEFGFSRVTHWARLPHHPEWNAVSFSEIPAGPKPPIVRYRRSDDLIEIFGGSSPYTEANPYYLSRNKFTTCAAALKAMAHLAGKTWATNSFMHRLAAILNETITANGEPPERIVP